MVSRGQAISQTILLISDAADAKSVRGALSNSQDGLFKVDWVRCRADALKRLAKASAGDIVAVLVDLFLPDSSGLDTFAHLLRTVPHIPILILSDAEHEEVARQAVGQGAQDYFLKERIDEHLLPKALRTIIERAVISTDLWGRVTYLNGVAEKMTGWTREEAVGCAVDEVLGSTTRALSQRMWYLAQHDSLTDLPNRVLLSDRLSHAVSLAHRRRRKMAVLFLDIDRFKHINDSLGHEVGDRLLQSVARRLLGCVRRSDTVSRQGGDEFVILLSEINEAQDAAVSAEKMLLALSVPHCIGQHELRITGSIGIVVYPDDGVDPEVLLKHADFAMYHAKEQGRNQYQFFEPNLNMRALERQVLESGLRRALDGQELMLSYQPRMNLQTGDIVGVEAFVRWRHPERGLILPSQFVPIAEACGAIVPIGRWVLRESCRQVRAWRDAGVGPISLAINVSATELRDREFVHCIRRILEETGLAPTDLELELREAVLMQDAQFAHDVLRSLKELEVQLALDDFGTGYSSLSNLKQFPIDILKIDGSFVRELTTDPDATGIVSAVIGMGKNLGMQVVAEGVESREQLTCLQQLACPQGQGFYLSEPLSPAEFARLALSRELVACRPVV